MVGAIIGDVIGSSYEFHNVRYKDFDLFNDRTKFTDDTVCTIALMDFFTRAEKFDEETATKFLHEWTNKYPDAGYGGRFYNWVHSSKPQPYDSYGNGSAMRISSVAWVAKDLDELKLLSDTVTKITHNNPEGMKGALVVATCIFMARKGASRKDIEKYAISQYPEIAKFDYEDLRRNYYFNETCQESVPQAIYCFLISHDFEDCLRTTISIGGDCDTTAAMSCAIAEAFYMSVPEKLAIKVLYKLTEEMVDVLDAFRFKYYKFDFEKRMKQYNDRIDEFTGNHRLLNRYVMTHTYDECIQNPAFKALFDVFKKKQYIVFEKDEIDVEKDGPTTNIIVSDKRTFQAASAYKDKKIAVLNFANNHSIGGSPYYAGAQEESLCRISTLLPYLEEEEITFYKYHQDLFDKKLINQMGNDDLIYTPGVTVFKTDESAPKMNDVKDWFGVSVITSAAPELHGRPFDEDKYLSNIILPRLRKVFQVAKKEKIEVLILGAWGCGAFGNPPEIIAKAFKILCEDYRFDTIEFAIDCSRGSDTNFRAFKEVFER